MKRKDQPQYPLIWRKDDFYIKIYASIPNIATGILLTTDQATFIVDPGDGILRDLNKDVGAVTIIKISDIFITHGHHDHVGGVWSLLTYLSVIGKKNSLTIHYPKKCVEIESIYNAFISVYGKELSYKIVVNPIAEEKIFSRSKIKIKPFWVNHKELSRDGKSSEVIPSLGFKFYYDNKSICYGGDTALCQSLVKNSKNSDLAIIEAGAKYDSVSDLHLTIDEAVKIGKSAKDYFLVHVPE